MFIVIVIFVLTLKFIFKKPFEKEIWRQKKKFVKLLDFYFFGSCEILIFLAQGQSWMSYLGVLCLFMMDLFT